MVDDLRSSTDPYTVIHGRRWRRSDPSLDDGTRQLLVDELMDARRAVKSALSTDDSADLRRARSRVNDAKVALGERGPKWWEPMTNDEVRERISAARRALTPERPDATPGDVSGWLDLRPIDDDQGDSSPT